MSVATKPDPSSFTTGHVGLNVVDLERSLDFYRQAFGFEVLGDGRGDARPWVFLGAGDALLLTLWQQAEGSYRPDTAGLHHLSFMVGSVAEVEAAATRLRALGAAFTYDGVVTHAEGAESGGIFFDDPDGTRLEIFAPSGVMGDAPDGASPTCGLFQ